MASPFILNNLDLQFANSASQDYTCYLAFLNPVSITTMWSDLNQDKDGNWQPPPNLDTAAKRLPPYAPTCNLGSNRIGFVNEPLYFDGSRSCQRHDVPAVSSSYLWNVSGPATVTLYANKSQCSIVWSAPGLYTVTLSVADIAGTRTTGTRQVMVYQDRSSALPGVISISGLSGSLSSGGWQCQLTTVNSQVSLFSPDQLAIGTYQPLVILIETRYEVIPGVWVNATIGPHGSFSPGFPYQDPRIFFDGYVQSGSIHQDVDKDTLSFSCIGPQMILQESKTHMLGYYNAVYQGFKGQVPTGLKPSAAGKGYLVGWLQTADIIRSLLQTHCNISQFHDIHIWDANIPYTYTGQSAHYNQIYTSLSVNEGTIWSNIQDLTSNEWSQSFCERDGSIRVGPQINYRGNEFWQQPTLLGQTVASTLLNFVQDLGLTAFGTSTAVAQSIGQLPATPMPIQLVHGWGHQVSIPNIAYPFQPAPSPDVTTTQQGLNGPPILCVFSDTPTPDAAGAPPVGIPLYPWVSGNWPQDLSVYPISFDITENYTGKTSLVKIIGTLVNANNIWSAWYPQNAFSVAGDGTSTIVAVTLPAGNWVVDERHVLPDITTNGAKQLMSNWWWEMARRVYYAQNINYACSISLGLFTAASLGDIVGVTRQQNTLGPHWSQKPFYIQEIAYGLDLTAKTWTTTLTCVEVTSALLTPMTAPPKVIPKY